MAEIPDIIMPPSLRTSGVKALRTLRTEENLIAVSGIAYLAAVEHTSSYPALIACSDWFQETVERELLPDKIVEHDTVLQRYTPNRIGVDYDVHLDNSYIEQDVYEDDMILCGLSTSRFRSPGVIVFETCDDLKNADPDIVIDVRQAKKSLKYAQARRNGQLMRFSPRTEFHAGADLNTGDFRLRMRARPKKPPLI